jgi:hypothetical protein
MAHKTVVDAMATLSALVKAIAAVQGFDENQVLWIARYLREDGLISQGGRGRGGARMSALDAANLLIGVNSPGSAKQSAMLVPEIAKMPLINDFSIRASEDDWDAARSGDALSLAFRRRSEFRNVLVALIEAFGGGESSFLVSTQSVKVVFYGPLLSASVYIGEANPERDGDVWASAQFSSSEELVEEDGETPDNEISRAFTQRTLRRVAEVLAT